uniref:Uncharacterized protein n=1 Tax=Romanomermis culicivorax TaxID=13658 RepID=A0A915KJT3_ROMCU
MIAVAESDVDTMIRFVEFETILYLAQFQVVTMPSLLDVYAFDDVITIITVQERYNRIKFTLIRLGMAFNQPEMVVQNKPIKSPNRPESTRKQAFDDFSNKIRRIY